MSVGPILPGRLPTSVMAAELAQNLNSIQDQLGTLEQQISSGQQLVLPSDNPTASTIAIALQEEIQGNSQYQTNVGTDQSFLQSTDSALQSVSSAISQANALLLSGLGAATTSTQQQALADQVNSIIQGLVNTANATFQGRYLFGGSQSTTPPFQALAGGVIRYNGDQAQINSNVGSSFVLPNNIDGITAFGATSTPVGGDVNPGLTSQTALSALNQGRGVSLGQIKVTVDTGTPATETIDLSRAQTVGDVQQLIQNAFPPGTLTASINSASPQGGLTITPASGTVAVSDVAGERTAADLGIASPPSASIVGSNLSPNLTLQTLLSGFNGGAGISQSHGILINDGTTQKVVDISSDVTVQDLFNTLTAADPNIDVGINAAGNGLAISTRLSGANFSIGENGGNDAASLGIRTFTGSTLLSSLNLGQGVPLASTNSTGANSLTIQLRDGSTANVDLTGATTVQDVLDKINAIHPGQLVASLNSVGNGISIVDNDGVSTGPLTVESNNVSTALGIVGTQSSTDATQPLVGQDVNPIQANGVFNLLEQLQSALTTGSTQTLTRLQPLFQQELGRVSDVQATLGSREQLLSQLQSQLQTSQTALKSSLSDQLDTNMADALTRLTQLQTSMQATLQITASSLHLSLFNYL